MVQPQPWGIRPDYSGPLAQVVNRVRLEWDPPAPVEVLPPSLQRLVMLAVVNEAIQQNPGLVRVLVARSLGYDELADWLESRATTPFFSKDVTT